ncbi:hypothetical protein SAY86_032263 [Trapa natans]|uniref:Methyltransferase n=1 Tax=Trapa natans TaxID=22666 RepID=A0AAN7LT96_TRANT|nr:hypothetical protein SAY86_032263 [Trapa natans]
MHKAPTGYEVRGSQWPEQWPVRLDKTPYWLLNSQVGVYGKPAPEDFTSDYEHWKRVVSKSYLTGIGIDWSTVRNVMDMRSVYGGFAAVLKDLSIWVMNVVAVDSPDTLPIIYERDFTSDYEHWKRVVSKSYLTGIGIDWSTVRNVMDMRSVYGGFAAVLKDLSIWVMNVVAVDSPDTLPIIYERDFTSDYEHWKRVVSKSYLTGIGIDWSTVRNVMDMRFVYGGFAAVLKDLSIWVMNVVAVDSPDTLPIIYERVCLEFTTTGVNLLAPTQDPMILSCP